MRAHDGPLVESLKCHASQQFPDAKLRPQLSCGSSLNPLPITRTLASLRETSVERYSTDGTV